ncbi:MAG: [protein-PII] uridylyltransferase [Desulfosudaceae bacterium]
MITSTITSGAGTVEDAPFRLREERRRLMKAFFEKRTVPSFMKRHTALLDQYFINSFANSHIGPRLGFHKNPYAIIALGGYGRQEQCLHSDIDILVLFEKTVPAEAEGIIREMLYPLWDLGFEVGHATRSVKESLKLAAEDLDVMTALLDARFLCGMSTLYSRLRERLHRALSGSRAEKAMVGLIDKNHQRHLRFGDSSYLLEPNLKDGQGGLRDYHTLLWVARIKSRLTTPRDLEYYGYLSHDEYQRLQTALGFIWKVRNHLHHLVGRKFDQLYLEHQQAVADRLNFKKTRGQLAVERFLGKLHAEMEFIKQTNLVFVAEAGSFRKSAPRRKDNVRTTKVAGLKVADRLIEFDAPEMIPGSPDLLLKIFRESARRQMALSWEARRIVREFANLVNKAYRSRPQNVEIFEQILATPAEPFNALNQMLQTGLLVRFVPPLKSIINRIQFDGYHRYPVDRHSLRTVRIMKTFTPAEGSSSLLADLYRETGRHKTELLWAALLHDIGKGQAGPGHARRGALIAGRFLKTLNYPPERIETIMFLIEHHLFLIKVATRRDGNDEETAIHCARTIKSAPRLKMLYLLTAADSMTTGPKAWNDWTAELLRHLFFKVLHVLEKGELASDEAVATVEKKKAAVLASAASRQEESRLADHLINLSPRYLLSVDDRSIINHLDLAGQLGHQPFAWQVAPGRNHRTRMVTVCAPDRPGLFSRIAAVFALNGLDVLEAEIHTWKNDIALDIFTVRPPADPIYEEERWQKVAADLALALENKSDPTTAVTTMPGRAGRPACYAERPPRVVIDNETSGFFTIIEVFSHNCPGLLFYITDTLFRHHLDIRVAKNGTKVDQVVDVFYVRDREGRKLDDPDRIETLRSTIVRTLTELTGPEANINQNF